MKNVILHGDCLEKLSEIEDDSIDAVVTDPPYGLSKEPDITEVLTKWLAGEDYHHRGGGFMGKTWDSFVPGPSIWREVFRVLKPGGHVLCFAGTRTQDLMTISLRMAGFEIRDVIEWLYFSGFPKSMDVSKAFDKRAGAEREVIGLGNRHNSRAFGKGNGDTKYGSYKGGVPYITAPATDLAKKWDGWGTALKPAHEPIILCRKPLEGAVCDNVEKYGTGALNIDGCRIKTDDFKAVTRKGGGSFRYHGFATLEELKAAAERGEKCPDGRDAMKTYLRAIDAERITPTEKEGRFPANCITTEPDMFYSKYFNVTPQELCKKASKKDRNSDWRGEPIDLEPKELRTYGAKKNVYGSCPKHKVGMPSGSVGGKYPCGCPPVFKDEYAPKPKMSNNHPTVKPTDLMAWLIRLITPPGGTVLDPFAGSGSTLVAAKREGFYYIGIEREAEYVEIARARVGDEGELENEGESA